MGTMTFLLPTSLPSGAKIAVEQARFAGGYDRTPFPTRAQLIGNKLNLTRAQNESGFIGIPWPIDGIGFPVTATSTLRERSEPYQLLVELARGKLNQVRSHLADWRTSGLLPNPIVMTELKKATHEFAQAALNQQTPESDTLAAHALRHAYSAGKALTEQFAETAIRVRSNKEGDLPLRWSCQLSEPPTGAAEAHFLQTFNSPQFVPNWAQLEPEASCINWEPLDNLFAWSEKHQLRPSVGPLIDLASNTLPKWLDGSVGELTSLAAYFCDFVETLVHRYKNRTKNWIICTGFNCRDRLGLSEDDRLRLVVRLIDAARTADTDGRWTVGLTQPWGDYLDNDESTYSPLVFADTLMRSGLPITSFQLELLAGTNPKASLLRDGLEIVRLYQLFELLNVPLEILASHPGTGEEQHYDSLTLATQMNRCWLASQSTQAQDEWGGIIANLCLSLPLIRSFTWGQLIDPPAVNLDSPQTAFDGLLNVDGSPKPLARRLRTLRSSYIS